MCYSALLIGQGVNFKVSLELKCHDYIAMFNLGNLNLAPFFATNRNEAFKITVLTLILPFLKINNWSIFFKLCQFFRNQRPVSVHSLYLIFPRCAPEEGSDDLARIQGMLGTVEAGEGRTFGTQAVMQLVCLCITLAIAVIGGGVTGIIINIESLFDPLRDHELFNDDHYWSLPSDVKDLKEKEFTLEPLPSNGDRAGSFSKVAPEPWDRPWVAATSMHHQLSIDTLDALGPQLSPRGSSKFFEIYLKHSARTSPTQTDGNL